MLPDQVEEGVDGGNFSVSREFPILPLEVGDDAGLDGEDEADSEDDGQEGGGHEEGEGVQPDALQVGHVYAGQAWKSLNFRNC